MRLNFNEMSDTIREKFENEVTYMDFSRLCIDTAKKSVKKYSLDEANEAIRNTIKEMAGLSDKPTAREVKRAFKRTSVREAVFEVIEDTLDDFLITGWSDSPVWRKYVESKIGAYGQTNSFYVKDNCILTVSEIADGHHSIERQRLGAGKEFRVNVKTYGVKVYMEMARFLQGVEDWSALIAKIADAFTRQINTQLYNALVGAGKNLPVPSVWNIEGKLESANHDKFVQLITDVQLATGGVATIVGTKAAIAGLKNLGDVAWVSDSAKEDVYKMGRLGTFEGTQILELPQAFNYNDVEKHLGNDNVLFIMPSNIDQFIKLFYEGAEETLELSNAGDNADDTKEYEFRCRYGIAAVTNVRFGTWTIAH